MSEPIRRNALDTALIKLNQAQHYLELPSPGKKDFEQARDHTKDGLDLIKACLVALDHDCFEIMDRPPSKPEPGPGLFMPDGGPRPETEVSPSFETAQPVEPAPPALPTIGCIDVEVVTRAFKVGDRVRATASSLEDEGNLGTVMDDDGSPEDEAPYFVHFDDDLSPEAGTWQDAEDIEHMPEGLAKLDADAARLEITGEPFPKGTKPAQKKVFEERLVTLEDMFSDHEEAVGREDHSEHLKAFRPHREAWAAAWKADPEAVWKSILTTIWAAQETKLGETFTTWSPAVQP